MQGDRCRPRAGRSGADGTSSSSDTVSHTMMAAGGAGRGRRGQTQHTPGSDSKDFQVLCYKAVQGSCVAELPQRCMHVQRAQTSAWEIRALLSQCTLMVGITMLLHAICVARTVGMSVCCCSLHISCLTVKDVPHCCWHPRGGLQQQDDVICCCKLQQHVLHSRLAAAWLGTGLSCCCWFRLCLAADTAFFAWCMCPCRIERQQQ